MTKRLVPITVLTLLTLAAVAWTVAARDDHNVPDQTPPESVAEAVAQPDARQDPLMEERTKGDPAAPLKIFEVSDFQCPFCRQFWEETLPQLEREYIETGKAQLIFLNLPITELHPNAAAAHELAMCAAKQDRFWPVHDLLFRYQDAWGPLPEPTDYFNSLADSASLEPNALADCLETGAVRWLIRNEAVTIAQSGVRSTPSFIIEGGLLQGAEPIETWRPILDSLFLAVTTGN